MSCVISIAFVWMDRWTLALRLAWRLTASAARLKKSIPARRGSPPWNVMECALNGMARDYDELARGYRGESIAVVTSAIPLKEAETVALRAKLEKKTEMH